GIISEWLKDMGLELKPSKTRLTHTLNEYESEKPGFNFLGFNISQFKVGKYHSKQGFKTIITPSKEKQKIHFPVYAITALAVAIFSQEVYSSLRDFQEINYPILWVGLRPPLVSGRARRPPQNK
ncbi:MAG: hypothetical protein ACYTXY_44755, partial [Nostoc sp.]